MLYTLLLVEVLMWATLAYIALVVFSVTWFGFGVYLVVQGFTRRRP